MHRFFAPPENYTAEAITLDESESRHLQKVLRLRSGGEVLVFDGSGSEYLCIIEGDARRQTLKIRSRVEPRSPESPLRLIVACAMLKGDKFDLVVQKAVELGVNQLIPLATERCDVKFTGSQKRVDRWERIALDATKQCGRAELMEVLEPCRFDEFIREPIRGTALLFAERGGSTLDALNFSAELRSAVGPEGGWSDEELEKARGAGFSIITLGGRILRAETAAITVAALLQHRFGDLN